MIQLHKQCPMFLFADGKSLLSSMDQFTVEIKGEAIAHMDPAMIQNAAEAVLHYYKHELKRASLTVGEFSQALESVLDGLGLPVTASVFARAGAPTESDLYQLAQESGAGFELAFFARLRGEMKQQLTATPRLLRFRRLRVCVKHLAGTRRWNNRCRNLSDQIVDYLRHCLSLEPGAAQCALLVH